MNLIILLIPDLDKFLLFFGTFFSTFFIMFVIIVIVYYSNEKIKIKPRDSLKQCSVIFIIGFLLSLACAFVDQYINGEVIATFVLGVLSAHYISTIILGKEISIALRIMDLIILRKYPRIEITDELNNEDSK